MNFLRLILLALTLALGWLVLDASGRAGDERLVDDATLEEWVVAAKAALTEGADITLPEPVPVVLLTAAEARERRERYREGREDAFGMSATVDRLADAMFSEAMLGRYLPDEKAIYIMEDVLLSQAGGDADEARELLFPVLAHELVHAYDDQVHGVVPSPEDLTEVIGGDPEAIVAVQTRMSLLEGRATYASILACEVAGVEPLPEPTVEDARRSTLLRSDGSFGGDFAAGFGNSIGRLKLIQYAQGIRFARRAHDYGGEAYFTHIFEHLPLSFAELEDFDLFVVRWAEELEAAMDAEADAADADDAGAPDEGGDGAGSDGAVGDA